MATSRRDTSTVVKEKRGTSPSSSGITSTQSHSQRSTKQCPIAASTDKVKSPQSAPAAASRQAPNYLRSTLSSRPESFKYVKKSSPGDSTQKPDLIRRRSFDKPPSLARADKAHVSPGSARERVVTVRSSSFTPRTNTSPKPIMDKISKTPKAVKSQFPSSSKSIKKTPSPSTKKGTNASASRKPPSTVNVTQTSNPEGKQEDIEAEIHGVQEIVNVESEVQVPCEMTESDDKENAEIADTEVNDDEKLKSSDISTVTSEDLSVHQTGEIEETEEKTSTQNELEESDSKDESSESHQEESLVSEAKIEAEAKGEDNNVSEEFASGEVTGDQNMVDGKAQGDGGSEGAKAKEGQQAEGTDVEEAKPELENVVASRQVRLGKKESPGAYNDVIEETTSKLLEKRKNKVKALVGAFETVIDYETPSK
ncbi:CaM_binding domain-containing protein [Cephalotus follicularis]|uniref:CaM_binding domain-containing protein n=1 Tax=Cephalotus follicularis TaxID=3775 RepID=A0A1Q3CCD1_CEPFO|nr:CaM_binding domain-containing protein [Cephalotus follicularis]